MKKGKKIMKKEYGEMFSSPYALIVRDEIFWIDDMKFDCTHHKAHGVDGAPVVLGEKAGYQLGLTLFSRLRAEGHRAQR